MIDLHFCLFSQRSPNKKQEIIRKKILYHSQQEDNWRRLKSKVSPQFGCQQHSKHELTRQTCKHAFLFKASSPSVGKVISNVESHRTLHPHACLASNNSMGKSRWLSLLLLAFGSVNSVHLINSPKPVCSQWLASLLDCPGILFSVFSSFDINFMSATSCDRSSEKPYFRSHHVAPILPSVTQLRNSDKTSVCLAEIHHCWCAS